MQGLKQEFQDSRTLYTYMYNFPKLSKGTYERGSRRPRDKRVAAKSFGKALCLTYPLPESTSSIIQQHPGKFP